MSYTDVKSALVRPSRLHLPALPLLHSHYRSFIATMFAVTPDLPFGSSAPSLMDHELPLVRWAIIADSRAQPAPLFCIQPPCHHCRRFRTLPTSAKLSPFHASDF